VPLQGKKGSVGTIALGKAHAYTYSIEELDFLHSSASQVGIAVENLRPAGAVLRSQRQWMNTFDSIQDAILAHDAESVNHQANEALLQHLGLAPADVMGNTCDDALPHDFREVDRVPVLLARRRGLRGGPGSVFRRLLDVSTSSYSEQGGNRKEPSMSSAIRPTVAARKKRYRLLFEQVQQGVFVATPEGNCSTATTPSSRCLGYETREELMALNINKDLYVLPEQREAFRKEIDAHNYVRNF